MQFNKYVTVNKDMNKRFKLPVSDEVINCDDCGKIFKSLNGKSRHKCNLEEQEAAEKKAAKKASQQKAREEEAALKKASQQTAREETAALKKASQQKARDEKAALKKAARKARDEKAALEKAARQKARENHHLMIVEEKAALKEAARKAEEAAQQKWEDEEAAWKAALQKARDEEAALEKASQQKATDEKAAKKAARKARDEKAALEKVEIVLGSMDFERHDVLAYTLQRPTVTGDDIDCLKEALGIPADQCSLDAVLNKMPASWLHHFSALRPEARRAFNYNYQTSGWSEHIYELVLEQAIRYFEQYGTCCVPSLPVAISEDQTSLSVFCGSFPPSGSDGTGGFTYHDGNGNIDTCTTFKHLVKSCPGFEPVKVLFTDAYQAVSGTDMVNSDRGLSEFKVYRHFYDIKGSTIETARRKRAFEQIKQHDANILKEQLKVCKSKGIKDLAVLTIGKGGVVEEELVLNPAANGAMLETHIDRVIHFSALDIMRPNMRALCQQAKDQGRHIGTHMDESVARWYGCERKNHFVTFIDKRLGEK